MSGENDQSGQKITKSEQTAWINLTNATEFEENKNNKLKVKTLGKTTTLIKKKKLPQHTINGKVMRKQLFTFPGMHVIFILVHIYRTTPRGSHKHYFSSGNQLISLFNL